MFKITPIQDKEMQKKYASECGISCREDFFGYAMLDVDTLELMGMAQFEINADGGYIADLVPKTGYDDFEAMFILGRQTMNFIDLCGVHYATYVGNGAEDSLLRKIGFKQNTDGLYEIDLNGFFTDHCH